MTNNRGRIIWQEMETKATNPPFRHPIRAIGALLLALAMVLAGSPVAEARRDEPKQSGPINFDERECASATFRTKVNGRREVVAKTETCLLLYNYDPLREDNEERDYAIAWVQARVEPRGAWCATRVWSDLGLLRAKFHKRTPTKNFSMKKSRRVQVKLASTANGFGDEAASLKEWTWFHPRRVRHSRTTIRRSRIFTQRWTGRRGRPLNLTSGGEISWDVEDKPPAFASGLRYDFERRGRCQA